MMINFIDIIYFKFTPYLIIFSNCFLINYQNNLTYKYLNKEINNAITNLKEVYIKEGENSNESYLVILGKLINGSQNMIIEIWDV